MTIATLTAIAGYLSKFQMPPSGYYFKRIQSIGKDCGALHETDQANSWHWKHCGDGQQILCVASNCQTQKSKHFQLIDDQEETLYWPRYVKGEQIKEHFVGKDAGAFNATKGK